MELPLQMYIHSFSNFKNMGQIKELGQNSFSRFYLNKQINWYTDKGSWLKKTNKKKTFKEEISKYAIWWLNFSWPKVEWAPLAHLEASSSRLIYTNRLYFISYLFFSQCLLLVIIWYVPVAGETSPLGWPSRYWIHWKT